MPFRLTRSVIYAIGHVPLSLEAAAASDADAVLFELEDAVPVGVKDEARQHVVRAIDDLDWGAKTLTVRINALDSPFAAPDVMALLESPAAGRLDCLMLPKTERPADVAALEALIARAAPDRPEASQVGIDLMIETAAGVAHLDVIASASRRVESLQFGSYDYERSIRARPADGIDHLVHPLGRTVIAARASGLRPIDSAIADFSAEQTDFVESARRGHALGCAGKQVLTSDQARHVNELYTPSDAEVAHAREVVDAAERTDDDGVVSVDGMYVDADTIERARDVVATAAAIADR